MAGTAAGHVIWKRRLNLAGITTLPGLLIISTTVGGFLAAPFWWFDLPASFAWDLPPLAARMLSAASLAFGVAGLLVLRRPEQGPCRFYNTMLAFCLVPLAMAAVIFDIERFDFGLPVTYGFFAVVLVLSTSSLSALFPPMEIVRVPRAAKAPEPPSPSLRTGFVFLAAAFGVWGVALFVLPDELSGLWSLWPGDTLTSRLNAATKLALAAAFAMAVRDRQHVAPALLFASVYGFGVLAACLVSLVEGDTGPRGFAAVFGALGATSTAMLAARHRSRDSAP
ncbi:hypothetical protein [Hoeflea marina]|nr:hypothetical protein [Hoeflea marina]